MRRRTRPLEAAEASKIRLNDVLEIVFLGDYPETSYPLPYHVQGAAASSLHHHDQRTSFMSLDSSTRSSGDCGAALPRLGGGDGDRFLSTSDAHAPIHTGVNDLVLAASSLSSRWVRTVMTAPFFEPMEKEKEEGGYLATSLRRSSALVVEDATKGSTTTEGSAEQRNNKSKMVQITVFHQFRWSPQTMEYLIKWPNTALSKLLLRYEARITDALRRDIELNEIEVQAYDDIARKSYANSAAYTGILTGGRGTAEKGLNRGNSTGLYPSTSSSSSLSSPPPPPIRHVLIPSVTASPAAEVKDKAAAELIPQPQMFRWFEADENCGISSSTAPSHSGKSGERAMGTNSAANGATNPCGGLGGVDSANNNGGDGDHDSGDECDVGFLLKSLFPAEVIYKSSGGTKRVGNTKSGHNMVTGTEERQHHSTLMPPPAPRKPQAELQSNTFNHGEARGGQCSDSHELPLTQRLTALENPPKKREVLRLSLHGIKRPTGDVDSSPLRRERALAEGSNDLSSHTEKSATPSQRALLDATRPAPLIALGNAERAVDALFVFSNVMLGDVLRRRCAYAVVEREREDFSRKRQGVAGEDTEGRFEGDAKGSGEEEAPSKSNELNGEADSSTGVSLPLAIIEGVRTSLAHLEVFENELGGRWVRFFSQPNERTELEFVSELAVDLGVRDAGKAGNKLKDEAHNGKNSDNIGNNTVLAPSSSSTTRKRISLSSRVTAPIASEGRNSPTKKKNDGIDICTKTMNALSLDVVLDTPPSFPSARAVLFPALPTSEEVSEWERWINLFERIVFVLQQDVTRGGLMLQHVPPRSWAESCKCEECLPDVAATEPKEDDGGDEVDAIISKNTLLGTRKQANAKSTTGKKEAQLSKESRGLLTNEAKEAGRNRKKDFSYSREFSRENNAKRTDFLAPNAGIDAVDFESLPPPQSLLPQVFRTQSIPSLNTVAHACPLSVAIPIHLCEAIMNALNAALLVGDGSVKKSAAGVAAKAKANARDGSRFTTHSSKCPQFLYDQWLLWRVASADVWRPWGLPLVASYYTNTEIDGYFLPCMPAAGANAPDDALLWRRRAFAASLDGEPLPQSISSEYAKKGQRRKRDDWHAEAGIREIQDPLLAFFQQTDLTPVPPPPPNTTYQHHRNRKDVPFAVRPPLATGLSSQWILQSPSSSSASVRPPSDVPTPAHHNASVDYFIKAFIVPHLTACLRDTVQPREEYLEETYHLKQQQQMEEREHDEGSGDASTNRNQKKVSAAGGKRGLASNNAALAGGAIINTVASVSKEANRITKRFGAEAKRRFSLPPALVKRGMDAGNAFLASLSAAASGQDLGIANKGGDTSSKDVTVVDDDDDATLISGGRKSAGAIPLIGEGSDGALTHGVVEVGQDLEDAGETIDSVGHDEDDDMDVEEAIIYGPHFPLLRRAGRLVGVVGGHEPSMGGRAQVPSSVSVGSWRNLSRLGTKRMRQEDEVEEQKWEGEDEERDRRTEEDYKGHLDRKRTVYSKLERFNQNLNVPFEWKSVADLLGYAQERAREHRKNEKRERRKADRPSNNKDGLDSAAAIMDGGGSSSSSVGNDTAEESIGSSSSSSTEGEASDGIVDDDGLIEENNKSIPHAKNKDSVAAHLRLARKTLPSFYNRHYWRGSAVRGGSSGEGDGGIIGSGSDGSSFLAGGHTTTELSTRRGGNAIIASFLSSGVYDSEDYSSLYVRNEDSFSMSSSADKGGEDEDDVDEDDADDVARDEQRSGRFLRWRGDRRTADRCLYELEEDTLFFSGGHSALPQDPSRAEALLVEEFGDDDGAKRGERAYVQSNRREEARQAVCSQWLNGLRFWLGGSANYTHADRTDHQLTSIMPEGETAANPAALRRARETVALASSSFLLSGDAAAVGSVLPSSSSSPSFSSALRSRVHPNTFEGGRAPPPPPRVTWRDERLIGFMDHDDDDYDDDYDGEEEKGEGLHVPANTGNRDVADYSTD